MHNHIHITSSTLCRQTLIDIPCRTLKRNNKHKKNT